MQFYFKLPSLIGFRKFLMYFLFFGNLLFTAYIWFANSNYFILNPGDGNIWVALGRLFGFWAEILLLTELMLVGRVRWFEHLFGFDKLNKIHRWIGYSILAFMLAHPVFLIAGNAEGGGTSFLAQFYYYLGNQAYVLESFIALTIFLYIVYLSVFARKTVHYEVWYLTHLLTYVAIGLAFLHQLGVADLQTGTWPLYYWYVLNFGVFGIVLLYRFLMPIIKFFYFGFHIQNVVQETADTYSVYITGRHMERFKFQAGQYANINILQKGLWFTHPFSFSSAYNGQFIRFTIKSCGDYTNLIPTVKPGTRVIVDGPLGLFVEERAKREKFFFIAGGIGITPLRSMMESLAPKQKDMVLIHSVRTEKDISFKGEIDQLKQIDPSLKVIYMVSAPTEGYESGRLDKEKIVRLVPDFFDRDVFLCGPPPMMAAVVNDLKSLGFGKDHLHYEKFAF